MAIQMKATEPYLLLVLFCMFCTRCFYLLNVVEILEGDHSNESCWAVLPVVLFINYAVIEKLVEIQKCDHSRQLRAFLKQYFDLVLFGFRSMGIFVVVVVEVVGLRAVFT